MKRSNTQNLYAAIDNFREKREEQELCEKIAPVVDKFGESKYWKMNLRRKELEEPRLFKLDKGDLVENKCYIAIDDPRKEIPVVRRPKSSYTNYRNRDCDSVKKSLKNKQDDVLYHVNPSKKQNKFAETLQSGLISNRGNSNKHVQSGIINVTEPEKIFIWDKCQADDLIIEGKNKLKSEIQCIENNKDKNIMLYREMAQLETKFVETMEEEVTLIL